MALNPSYYGSAKRYIIYPYYYNRNSVTSDTNCSYKIIFKNKDNVCYNLLHLNKVSSIPFSFANNGNKASLHTSSNPKITTTKPATIFERVTDSFKLFRNSIFKVKTSTNSDNSSWNQVISEAKNLVQYDQSSAGGDINFRNSDSISYIDPMKLLGGDILDLTQNIKRLLSSKHPVLESISKYYFTSQGKHLRPLLVLLMSQATSLAPKQYQISPANYYEIIDTPLSSSPSSSSSFSELINESPKEIYQPSLSVQGTIILPTQRRLAEITEMIHTASLLHDDVIDTSETRRNQPSANASFGNKMTILAGDFLLARATIALARLRNPEIIELYATIITNLVEESEKVSTFDYYMEKSYMKTASLLANSCRGASILGGCTPEIIDIAYDYGRNLGLAFQLVDDMLDFTSSSDNFGKPVGADLKLGLATAPVLYAWEEFPELGPLIDRKFKNEGDVEMAHNLVFRSKGLEKTKLLAALLCKKAATSVLKLPKSDARSALIQLTDKVLIRNK
ncbi:3645_t:CDS:2 [Ambispora gerdemannii]|uniref:3645_t:CDS:1 n=1 Tax=Ambispora gerdemannii TaxID=144530 RepID=A0A9N9AZ15_9GLOM|nr:3645_t:CDS:2 [Ambispora gerdemannii]